MNARAKEEPHLYPPSGKRFRDRLSGPAEGPEREIPVILRTNSVQYAPRIDYNEKCTCGHYRYEHHSPFGCMNWDVRRRKGWCECEGFSAWKVLS